MGVAVPDDDPLSRKIPWFASVKGVIALVASVLAIIGSVLGIQKALNDRRGDPSFKGPIAAATDARRFVSFLEKNDQKDVVLDIQCVPTTTNDFCADESNPNDMQPVQVTKDEFVEVLEVFTGLPCNAESPNFGCPGTIWVAFRTPLNSEAQVNNGSFGAGNLVVKGKFRVLVRGGLGTLPPNVQLIEARTFT